MTLVSPKRISLVISTAALQNQKKSQNDELVPDVQAEGDGNNTGVYMYQTFNQNITGVVWSKDWRKRVVLI